MRSGTPADFDNVELLPFIAIDIAFDSGPFRVWTGYSNLTINGLVYSGAG